MKPDYYEDFTCIADRCSFTCCREWKIGVDEDTFVKWKHTLTPDGMYDTDRGQQAKKEKLSGYVRKKDGSRVIGLNKEKNCPFLNGKKLCRLVLTYGDEILSQTCQLFPREIHTFNEDVTEYALMPSCPAVIDLLRKREHISFSGEMDTSAYRELAPLVNLRAFLMKLMEDGAHTPEHNLMKIFYVLLDLYERVEDEQAKDGCMENKQVKDAAEDALGLDLTDMAKMYPGGFLLELSETIDGIEQTLQYSIEERNELFLDLAENYRREGLYEKYLEPVAQLAEQLSEQGIDEEVVKEWREFEVQFLKYQPLMRRFLLTELYADSLKPEGNLEEMVVQVQWIAMEYTMIRHSLFLKWMQDGCRDLAYETLRDYLVLITRMTGYEEDDIYEYLENSFDELVWEWGYLSLIVGK